jgi:DNA-binding transcriptional ArsR family regulator
MQTQTPDRVSLTFAALADPTRRAILARLASGEASVTDLAKPFDMSMPAISKHLQVLERAGLIGRGRDAQWRPCRLEAAPLKEVADWVEHYRRFWEQSFDRLDAYLQELKSQQSLDQLPVNSRSHRPLARSKVLLIDEPEKQPKDKNKERKHGRKKRSS